MNAHKFFTVLALLFFIPLRAHDPAQPYRNAPESMDATSELDVFEVDLTPEILVPDEVVAALADMINQLAALLENQPNAESVELDPEIIALALDMFTTVIDTATNTESQKRGKKIQAQKPNTAQQEFAAQDAETTQIILGSFARIVNNFANIVAAPKDQTVVNSNIAQMFAGVITIVQAGTRQPKRDITPEKITDYLYNHPKLAIKVHGTFMAKVFESQYRHSKK